MIETRPCGCSTTVGVDGLVYHVGTCPKCLPPGAITWLIENGRQLDLLEDGGVAKAVRGLESIEKYAQDPSEILTAIRAVDPSF